MRLIGACGLLLAILFLAIGHLPQRLEAHPESYVPVFLIAFVVYACAARVVWTRVDNRRDLTVILLFAVVFRCIAVFQPASLSTDIRRYVWDGHVSLQGVNPYRYPPSAPETTPYRTDYWETINHPTWVTMYPPLSQRVFAVIAFLGGDTPFAFKLAFSLCDVACIALILLLLRRAGAPDHRVLLYAWHPLVVMELSGSGHQDVLGILFMLVAVVWIRRSDTSREGFLGGIGAGLSLMGKGYLLPSLPIFARKRPLVFIAAVAVTVAVLLLPYAGGDSRIADGMSRYLQNRLRNAGPFAITLTGIDALLPGGKEEALRWTRWVMTGLLGAVVAWLAWRPWRDEKDLLVKSTSAMGVFFLLSHTVYPWYATWLVPGLCFAVHPAWLAWSGLISLAYLNPLPGRHDWVPYVEYGAVALLLAATGISTRRRRSDPGKGSGTAQY